MQKKKPWILRLVAWILTMIATLLLNIVAELLCLAGEYVIAWLGGFSTVVIVILVMTFGSVFVSIFFYSGIFLPSLIVSASDKIYPSNHAFRYYFVGIYQIIGCAFLIFAAITGAVSGGSMFWFYVRYGWLIYTAIVMMINGNMEAKERHRDELLA